MMLLSHLDIGQVQGMAIHVCWVFDMLAEAREIHESQKWFGPWVIRVIDVVIEVIIRYQHDIGPIVIQFHMEWLAIAVVAREPVDDT